MGAAMKKRRLVPLDRLVGRVLGAPRLLLFAGFTGAAVLVGEGLTAGISFLVVGGVRWTALVIGFAAGLVTSAAAAALFTARLARIGELQGDLARSARTDDLTGVLNHRALVETLAREIVRAQRLDGKLSVAFADLDRFKLVNDRLGHQVGDIVLREAGAALSSGLRAYDAVARYGGDEFVLVLPQAGVWEGHAVAERIRESIAGRSFTGSVSLTLSMGVAGFSKGMDADALLKAADAALLRAKRAGRNRCEMALEKV
jgi:diguanylate cyclase (GGDEF)-like protein